MTSDKKEQISDKGACEYDNRQRYMYRLQVCSMVLRVFLVKDNSMANNFAGCIYCGAQKSGWDLSLLLKLMGVHGRDLWFRNAFESNRFTSKIRLKKVMLPVGRPDQ